MEFEIIDGDFKIAACKIGDLTAELAESILKQWEPGATLHTLTLFTPTARQDPWKGWVIINKEHPDYDLLVMLAKRFLQADKEEQKVLVKKAPVRLKETVECIQKEARRREAEQLIKLTGYMTIGEDGLPVCGELANEFVNGNGENLMFLMMRAFYCGIIQGKRMERDRKKGDRKHG